MATPPPRQAVRGGLVTLSQVRLATLGDGLLVANGDMLVSGNR